MPGTFITTKRKERNGRKSRPPALPGAPVLREPDVTREYPWSTALLRKWRRCGGGPPFVRLNRAVYYRRQAIEAFLASHETC